MLNIHDWNTSNSSYEQNSIYKLNVNIKLFGLLDKRIITNELLYFSWKNIDVPRFSHVYVDPNESKLMIMMYGRGNASFTSMHIIPNKVNNVF